MRPRWFVRWLERWIDAKIRQSFQRYQMAQEWSRYRYICMQCHEQIAVSDRYCTYCGWQVSLPVVSGEHPLKPITFTGMMAVYPHSGTRPFKMYNALKKAGRCPTQVLRPLEDNRRDCL
jgi:predicted amidophosphoribosyltransferase